MANSSEPLLDMSEIVDLYKGDARKMVCAMRTAVGQWEEIKTGGTARHELRRLSHQLRGSGRTYGFSNVTRISKALEHILLKLETQALSADQRLQKSLERKIERLASIFKE